MFWLEFSFMWCGSVGRACYNTAYAANASKQICWALSSTKWHLLPVMAALILVCALSCWMSTNSDCQVFSCCVFFFLLPLRRMVMHWLRGFLTRSQGDTGSSWPGNHSVSPGRKNKTRPITITQSEHTVVKQTVYSYGDTKGLHTQL